MKSEEHKTLFSIIIPTYNRANMIGKAIESVLCQSYTNWELIIISDGSTDNTEEILNNYTVSDPRIKYFRQENMGRSSARNLGINNCVGDYVCFLDDDDFYLEDFLLEFSIEIENKKFNRTIFMCGQNELIDGNIVEFKIDEKKLNSSPLKYLIKYSNNIQPFCFPKVILDNVKFDERFELGEDFHLLIRILLLNDFYFISKRLCVYVNHSEMTMERELKEGLFLKLPFNRLDMLEDIYNEYQDLLIEKNVIKDFFVKYNQIAYFYASSSMKNYKNRTSFNYLRKLNFYWNIYISFYYFMSIVIRIPLFSLKKFFVNEFKYG